MKPLIGALVFVFAIGVSIAQEARYFPHFVDGIVGEIRYRTSLKLVNTGADAGVAIDFFDNAGEPTQVGTDSLGLSASSYEVEMRKGEVLSAVTPGDGPVKSGYVRLTAPESVAGTLIYTGIDVQTGTVLFEAGVPTTYLQRQSTVLLSSPRAPGGFP